MYQVYITQTNLSNYYTIIKNNKIIYDECKKIDHSIEEIIAVFYENEIDDYAANIIFMLNELEKNENRGI